MPNFLSYQPPEITLADIQWVCRMMKLPLHAFTNEGADPRCMVLQSRKTVDVDACPGSGKTTLLVAKLAILANTWADRRRGICVLSHTNAARDEIEKHLGTSAAGRALLSFPHFVGTIHAFVNEYLALPWLRSKQIPTRFIDDDVCLSARWKILKTNTRHALEKVGYGRECLRYVDSKFTLAPIVWGRARGKLGSATSMYIDMQTACRLSVAKGYFCHDEMFIWARELLDSHATVRQSLRNRFPLLFVDEVQDNSEEQSAILFRVFMEGDSAVIRHRFGDLNQAIFDRPQQTNGAQTDAFPGDNRCSLPNSFRFGQHIAKHANPLGVVPQGLVGSGPLRNKNCCKVQNAIILFPEHKILDVLPTYADYLIEGFSPAELKSGLFTAVAAVHRAPIGACKPCHFLGQYAPEYEPALNSKSATPKTFLQYLLQGQRRLVETNSSHPLVSNLSSALLHLGELAAPESGRFRRYKSAHRTILERLTSKEDACRSYVALINDLIDLKGDADYAAWIISWRAEIEKIGAALADAPVTSQECVLFVNDPANLEPIGKAGVRETVNIFEHPKNSPKVSVRLNSIHAVKGETHTATLVLESFYYDYHLQSLKDWLLGQTAGAEGQAIRTKQRLKLHYVAMSRPSHLLCLAIRRQTFGGSEMEILKSQGWNLITIT
jgi:DNA helicase II / ATP-dependent DNA helicase PcrA